MEADRARLAKGEPVAYIIGYQPFLGLKIYLDSCPLIPRPETEWWVSEMLTSTKPEPTERKTGIRLGLAARSVPVLGSGGEGVAKPRRCLDLCAGSGAIGCAMLAYLPESGVYFGEVDPAHRATIHKNIRETGMIYHTSLTRASVSIGDLFAPFPNERFDLIACNPPYIPEGRVLPISVTDYEPALALRSGADGLNLMRRLASEIPEHLAEGGQAWLECDSAHAQEAQTLFESAGLAAQIRTDQYGKPRVLVVHSKA